MRAALALVLVLAAGAAQAHTRGASYSWWTIEPGGAQVRARVSALELTRLQLDPAHTPDYLATAAATIAAGLRLEAGGVRCEPSPPRAAQHGGWIELNWTVRCPPGARVLVAPLFAQAAPGHLHFARVAQAGRADVQRVLTGREPALRLDGAQAPGSVAGFVALGFEHILSGWDHLAFVLALLLLCTRLREIVLVASAFTLAHSLTLALAVLGLARVQAHAVEALIALSIALAAAEGLWQRAGRRRGVPLALAALLLAFGAAGAGALPAILPAAVAVFIVCYFELVARSPQPARWRAAMGFGFGLVHGLGFAGALAQMELPRAALVWSLAAFNVGVELGQLLAIALAWPLLRLTGRRAALENWSRELAGAAICALGTYAFVVRAF